MKNAPTMTLLTLSKFIILASKRFNPSSIGTAQTRPLATIALRLAPIAKTVLRTG